jgi:hypothetical protein
MDGLLEGPNALTGDVVGERLGDLARGLSDQKGRPDMSARRFGERLEGQPLVPAAGDPDDWCRLTGECSQGSSWVGGLRVIDPLHPPDPPYRLASMGEAREAREGPDGLGRVGTRGGRGQQRRQGVFSVVPASQLDSLEGQADVLSAEPQDDGRTVPPGPPLAGYASPECVDLGADPRSEGRDPRVVAVQYGDVLRLLSGEDAALRRGVFLQAAVSVEMVLAQIQQRGDAGPERVRRLQLEGGDLEDGDVDGPAHQAEGGLAEVSGGQCPQPRGSQHRFDEAHRGRFPVGSGHRNDRDRERAEGELHVAPGPTSARPVALSRHARTRHHQVEVRRVGKGLAQPQCDAGRKLPQAFELASRPLVHGHHFGALGCAERGRAPPRNPEAQYQHPLS